MAKDAAKTHKVKSKSPKVKKSNKSDSKSVKSEAAKARGAENLRTITIKAVRALKEYFDKIANDSLDLVEKRHQVLVKFDYNKCPSNPDISHRPLRLSGVVNEDSKALLIVRTPETRDMLQEDAELSEKFDLILDQKSLMNEYSQTRERLNLFKSFDTFFCDSRCIIEVNGFLGYQIRNSWRAPIKIAVHLKDDLETLKKSLLQDYRHCTNYRMSEAPADLVRIGALKSNESQLADNLVEALKAMQKRIEDRKGECQIIAVSLVCSNVNVRLVEPPLKEVAVRATADEDEVD